MKIELNTDNVKKLLDVKGWTMAQLARETNTSYVSIYRLLNPERMGDHNKRNIGQEMVAKFLTALKCDFDDIFTITKED